MESKNTYAICPSCDKPSEQLIVHLKSAHGWDLIDIIDVMEAKLMMDGKKATADAAAGSSEELRSATLADSIFTVPPTKLELEVEGEAKRAMDRALMMHALADMNMAIGDVYKRIESNMRDIASEAQGKYMFAGRDVIDGPRRDILKNLRDVIVPSCDQMREYVTHELCRISNVLKDDISNLL